MIKIITKEETMYNDVYDSNGTKGYSLPSSSSSKEVRFLGIPLYKKENKTVLDSKIKLSSSEKNKGSIGYGAKK